MQDLGRAGRLKARTASLHEALDKRVMALRPFEGRERYTRLVRTQHAFFREIEPLYRDPAIAALVPDIGERSRLADAEADLRDLGVPPEDSGETARREGDPAAGLGWLYVAEGSKLGAAFLVKGAEQLGFGADFGARHLAAHPDGRGREWRRFVSFLNAAALSAHEEDRIEQGARAAFARFAHLLERAFARPEHATSPEAVSAFPSQPALD